MRRYSIIILVLRDRDGASDYHFIWDPNRDTNYVIQTDEQPWRSAPDVSPVQRLERKWSR